MRALAAVLGGRGWTLSGSDRAVDAPGGLAAAGVRVCRGHAAENVSPGTRWIVYSDAVPRDNPELRRAAQLGIPAVSYFEMVGGLTTGKWLLAVAGTHGKSTTTAMAAAVFQEAGLEPTVFGGAAPLGRVSGGQAGREEPILVEACEYRANFLHLRPQQAVILGIEPDHFDCYRRLGELEDAFARFARLIPSDGLILARHECRRTRTITAGAACRVATFGLDEDADWSARHLTARRGRYDFGICRGGSHVGDVGLRLRGRHNVLNALAAAALAGENGIPVARICRGLSRFRGLHRRLEVLGVHRGVLLVDDYAHHPTEVAAALQAVREMAPGRRLWCVFQPHQVSRTERLLDELAESLQNADKVFVAEIFRAREPPSQRGEVTAADLARLVRENGTQAAETHHPGEIARLLEAHVAPGDVLMTMGAGDIGRICRGFTQGSSWACGAGRGG